MKVNQRGELTILTAIVLATMSAMVYYAAMTTEKTDEKTIIEKQIHQEKEDKIKESR